MSWQTIAQNWLPAGRTRSIVTALALALLLAPIPAYAFTWLSPTWLLTIGLTGNPQPPFPIVTSTDTPTGGGLTVDMGQYDRPVTGSSVVTAKRDFTVGAGGETIDIGHQFETLARRTDIQVQVKIKPLAGGSTIKFPTFVASTNNTETIVGTDTAFSQFLAAGNYKMIVKVSYTKKSKGLWDNTPPPLGSPHRFTFNGV